MPPRAALALTLACAAACAADDAATATAGSTATTATTAPGEPQDLVDNALWQDGDPALDPLAAHRPALVECGLAGWYVEVSELEVDTNFCNYADLVQPALVDVPAGATLRVTLRHYDLTAVDPAEAHLALVIGGDIAWEKQIAVPGPAAVITEDAPIAAAHPAGTPVHLHLHNHGQNTWIFTSATVTPP